MENRFESAFDEYVMAGDRIDAEIDEFRIAARIEYDQDRRIDDDDCHNPDRSVTGCNDEQHAKLMKARDAWIKGEWFYCGVVLSVCKNGVSLDKHAVSVWGIEANYPKDCADTDRPNEYLTDVANELLDEAVHRGKQVLKTLCRHERTNA